MNKLKIIQDLTNKLLKYWIWNNNTDEICIIWWCVRDYILGTKFKDIDITWNIDPLIIKNIFKNNNSEIFIVPWLNEENFWIVKFKYKWYDF